MPTLVSNSDRSGKRASSLAICLGVFTLCFLLHRLSLDRAVAYESQLIRFIAALTAGLLFRLFRSPDRRDEGLALKGKIRGIAVKASGGLALFIFVFAFWGYSTASAGPRANSAQIDLRVTVVNAGYPQKHLGLRLPETGESFRTDANGSFRVRLLARKSLRVDVDGIPHGFDVTLSPSAEQYVRLELANPGPAIAEAEPVGR